MKNLISWGATLGLIASTIFFNGVSLMRPAFALPQEDVVKLLASIPTFILVDEKNFPLGGKLDEKTVFTNVFMSRQSAEKILANLKKEQPDVAGKYKIQLISLGAIYEIAQKNTNSSQRFALQYIPNQQEVEAAKPILSANGDQYEGGVPLYIARGGPEQAYLTIQRNGETISPVFFEKKTIQSMLDEFKKQQPDLAPTIKIEVVMLNNLIATLEQNDDDFMKSIRLWPSEEMFQIIRSSQQNQGNPQSAPQ
ncbi:MAG TPA: hypothetical protein DCF68_07220 [Cyanothece sp. UBA12306]|nr:hypothetical protein [Cyanothece sp. UBA12306]